MIKFEFMKHYKKRGLRVTDASGRTGTVLEVREMFYEYPAPVVLFDGYKEAVFYDKILFVEEDDLEQQ